MCAKQCHIEDLGVLYAINICVVVQQHLGELEGGCHLSWFWGGLH